MTDSNRQACKVCQEHGLQPALESGGLVIAGVQAVFDGDVDLMKAIYEQATPFDAHVAITYMAYLLDDVSHLLGVDPREYLRQSRDGINEQIAKIAAPSDPEAVDQRSTDGADGTE